MYMSLILMQYVIYGLDDDNHVVLQPLNHPECQNEFINASCIDVRYAKCQCLIILS